MHVRLSAADPDGRCEHSIETLGNRLPDEVSEQRVASQWQVPSMTFDRAEWNDRGCDTAFDDAAQLETREVLQLTHADTLAAGSLGRTVRCRNGLTRKVSLSIPLESQPAWHSS